MLDKIKEIEFEANQKIEKAKSSGSIEEIRVEFLGKKGKIVDVLKNLKSVEESKRKEVAMLANKLKVEIESKIESKKEKLKEKEYEDKINNVKKVDLTLPTDLNIGSLHPITIVQKELEEIFQSMGFTVEDGKTFDLTDPWDNARWEAIRNCPMIADFRGQRDAKGNLIIDGDSKRYGRAELYIERPGVEVQKKISKRQKIHDAESYIFDDPKGAEGRLKVARILGKHMSHASDSDIKDYLLEIASRDPDKIIKLYTGEDLELRILFLEARDQGIIRSVSGIYTYGEGISLGGTIDVAISWMRDPRNKKLLESIKRDTYPDLEVNNPKALEKLNNENK